MTAVFHAWTYAWTYGRFVYRDTKKTSEERNFIEQIKASIFLETALATEIM